MSDEPVEIPDDEPDDPITEREFGDGGEDED